MLAYYATRLPVVEINNTFYRMPNCHAIGAWRAWPRVLSLCDRAAPDHHVKRR
jgi:uncharacterized protein YecE (DUF72 family)